MAEKTPFTSPILDAIDPMGFPMEATGGSRVVVTGGAGYVGCLVVRWLLGAGFRVHAIDNLMYGPAGILPLFVHPNFSFSKLDVLEHKLLLKELKGADAVIHLAGLVGYPLCKKHPELAVRVNVDGTRTVAEGMPADAALIYGSTGSNYGEVAGVCTEETPLNPLSLYGETKTEAERICMQRPNTVSFRFATGFGLSPRLRMDLMINDFTYQALVQRFLVVYEKHFRRTFIHVQDAARVFLHTVLNWEAMKDEVYNVGDSSMNFTKEDITDLLKARIEFLLHFAEFGSDEDKRDYAVSYDKIRRAGFRTSISMERGLEELIAGLQLVEIRNPFSNV